MTFAQLLYPPETQVVCAHMHSSHPTATGVKYDVEHEHETLQFTGCKTPVDEHVDPSEVRADISTRVTPDPDDDLVGLLYVADGGYEFVPNTR